jgi:hypothetical protein
MRFRLLLFIPLLCATLGGQTPAIKDTFLQAKALWAIQGDREGATANFETVVTALAPRAAGLTTEWLQVLCESFNWLAILDDRSVQNRPRAQGRLQSLMDLNPDFELDRTLTSQRLLSLYDRLKSEKYALVKLSYEPEGGVLSVDGRPCAPAAHKHLAFGAHKLAYSRPGHTTSELLLELGPHDLKSADFKLTRTASTITLYTQPSNVEILLDGKSLGFAVGKAGPEAASLALPLGLQAEELSAPFVIPQLSPGKHRLELRAACLRTRVLELGAEFATPPADHTLEPIRMLPSRGTLSVSSAWPGGELYLSGQSHGPLPVASLSVCSGLYDLLVRFPAGAFVRRLTVEEGRTLSLEVQPKPRLAFLGLEGGDFTGRARFLAQLECFGDRLQQLAFVPPRVGESPAEARARLKASGEAELLLLARPVPDKVIHHVELVVATLDGGEEHLLLKPLEEDPLGPLAVRLNAIPPVQRPGLGFSALDLPGEPGPWVLAASEPAMKAGLQPGRSILKVQGQSVPTVQDLQKLVASAKEPVAILQEGGTAVLPIQEEALEVPLGSKDLCYPAVLAQLRLQYAGAKGDLANVLKLNMALVLMQFGKYDKAIELLRDAKLSGVAGISQGTIDYHTGLCFLHLGTAYQSEAMQAFRQALKYPQSTLLGPEGPLVSPLARQALEDLK